MREAQLAQPRRLTAGDDEDLQLAPYRLLPHLVDLTDRVARLLLKIMLLAHAAAP